MCGAFIQIQCETPHRVVVLLERKGLIRARVEENEQQLQKTKVGLDVGVKDVEVCTEETPHDTDDSSFRWRCARGSRKHGPVELEGG